MVLMAIYFLRDLYVTKDWKKIDKDFSIFAGIYGWKGITALANGAFAAVIEIRELWDKLPYIFIGRFSISHNVAIKTLHILFTVNSVLIVWAIGQRYLGIPEIYQSLFFGHGEARLIGYFGHPLHYGGFISLVAVLCFALSCFYKKEYALLLPILFTGLVMSGSRSYFLGVSVAILLVAFFKSKKFFVTTVFLLPSFLAGYAWLFPNFRARVIRIFETDLEGRIVYWQIAWEQFKEHPIFGIGYEQFSAALTPYHQQGLIPHPAHGHNIFTHDLAEGGFIGFGLIVFMFYYFGTKYFRLFRKEKDSLLKSIYIGLLASFVTIGFAGMFEYNFGTAVVWIQLTFIMGLAEGYRKWLFEPSEGS